MKQHLSTARELVAILAGVILLVVGVSALVAIATREPRDLAAYCEHVDDPELCGAWEAARHEAR